MRISIDIKIDYHKFKYETLEKLVNLKLGKIVFEKYGSHERDMKKIADTSNDDLRSHWDKYMSILIKGKNKFFLSLSTTRSGQIYGGGAGDFSEKAMDTVIKDLVLIMITLNENGALIFASVNSEEIHDLKHKAITKFKSGGSSYGWKGLSNNDFLEFLPGVRWFTFFGSQYIQCLGVNKLQNLDSVNYVEVGNGAIALKHKKNINEVSLLDLEQLEDQIGNQYFFSKERALENLCHPNGFKDYLASLEEEFNRKYS